MWNEILLIITTVSLSYGKLHASINIQLDWWETAVIYQIYTRSFMDSDGDGVGDINGITSRLEYLRELGVDAAWLSPIFKSPMHDFGYDVSDYYSIHHEYGSMEDFEQLLHKANELNIKIILDFVPNHTSNESEWFLKSTSRDEYYNDWYVWESGYIGHDGKSKPPNNWISVFRKSAWTYKPERDQYYLHQFGTAQPDLNIRNPVVIDELKSIIKFWLEKGVAGFRMNAVNQLAETDKYSYGGRFPNEPKTGKPGLGPDDYGYLNHVYTRDQEESYELVSQFRDVFDAIAIRDNMTRIMLTDAVTGIKNAVRYYGDNVHGGAHIPLNLMLMEEITKDSDARDLKATIDTWMTYKPLKTHANWMMGNHDRSRVASRFGPNLVDAFNMLVLLLPGIGITYMGEEIGMTNGVISWVDTKDPLACNTDDPVDFVKVSRDPARTPYQWNNGHSGGFSAATNPWLPVADGYEHLNLAAQKQAVRSHYQLYRTLTSLRRRPAFRIGKYTSLCLTNDVFAFKRWYQDDTYIVLMNVGKSNTFVNLSEFDLVFGPLEVEASSLQSSRAFSDNLQSNSVEISPDEALVLRMQV